MLISLAALTIVVILAIVGYGYYASSIAPGRAWLSTVNGTIRTVSFTGEDYLRMAELLGISAQTPRDYPLLMLEQYELMSQGVEDLGIEVADEEVTEKIRSVLFPDDEEVSEEEFQMRYEEAIADSGLSEEDFRWFFAYQLLQAKLDEYLREQVPQQALQLHVQGILVATEEDAATVMQRLEQGEDFASLAAEEFNLDPVSKENGGDLGWIPEGIKGEEFDEVAFELELGEVSQPFLTVQGYWVIKVLEREQNRALDEELREQLMDRAFNNWLAQEKDEKVERNPNLDLDRIYEWAVGRVS